MTGPQSRSLSSGLVPVALMVFGNIIFAFNDVWLRRVADDIGIAQTVGGRSILFLLIMTFGAVRLSSDIFRGGMRAADCRR